MGNINNMLSERHIGKRGMYSDHARLEISENIHFHWRDHRLVMEISDFESMCKMFKKAQTKWLALNKPTSSEVPYKNVDILDEQDLINSGYHSTRMAVEEQDDGTIHIHYRDLRMHFKPADFIIFAQQVETSLLQYNKLKATDVILADLTYHPVVNKYIQWLKEYDVCEKYKEEVITNMLEIKYIEAHPSDSLIRLNGLPKIFPGTPSEEQDKNYLISICESFKKYGYADGPFKYQYIRIYKQSDGILYVKDSHRFACLLHLGITHGQAIIIDSESEW